MNQAPEELIDRLSRRRREIDAEAAVKYQQDRAIMERATIAPVTAPKQQQRQATSPADMVGLDFSGYEQRFTAILENTASKLAALENQFQGQQTELSNQVFTLREQIQQIAGARTDAAISGRVSEARSLADRKSELEILEGRLTSQLSELEARRMAGIAYVYQQRQADIDALMPELRQKVNETKYQLETAWLKFAQRAGDTRLEFESIDSAAQNAEWQAKEAAKQETANQQRILTELKLT